MAIPIGNSAIQKVRTSEGNLLPAIQKTTTPSKANSIAKSCMKKFANWFLQTVGREKFINDFCLPFNFYREVASRLTSSQKGLAALVACSLIAVALALFAVRTAILLLLWFPHLGARKMSGEAQETQEIVNEIFSPVHGKEKGTLEEYATIIERFEHIDFEIMQTHRGNDDTEFLSPVGRAKSKALNTAFCKELVSKFLEEELDRDVFQAKDVLSRWKEGILGNPHLNMHMHQLLETEFLKQVEKRGVKLRKEKPLDPRCDKLKALQDGIEHDEDSALEVPYPLEPSKEDAAREAEEVRRIREMFSGDAPSKPAVLGPLDPRSKSLRMPPLEAFQEELQRKLNSPAWVQEALAAIFFHPNVGESGSACAYAAIFEKFEKEDLDIQKVYPGKDGIEALSPAGKAKSRALDAAFCEALVAKFLEQELHGKPFHVDSVVAQWKNRVAENCRNNPHLLQLLEAELLRQIKKEKARIGKKSPVRKRELENLQEAFKIRKRIDKERTLVLEEGLQGPLEEEVSALRERLANI